MFIPCGTIDGTETTRANRLTGEVTLYRYYSPQVPYLTNLFFVIVKHCSRPSATPNGRYFLILNNGNEEEMLVTFNKTLNYNTTLRFKCNAGFILPDMYDSYKICQENEKWSGLEPRCTGKYLGRQKSVFGVYSDSKGPH